MDAAHIGMATSSFAAQRQKVTFLKTLQIQRESPVFLCLGNRKSMIEYGMQRYIHACIEEANKTMVNKDLFP
jgi:hypothetical protein